MRIFLAFALIFASLYVNMPERAKPIDWSKYGFSMLYGAHYTKIPDEFPEDLRRFRYDEVILEIVQDKYYEDPHNFNLVALLGNIKGKTKQETLEKLNNAVNHLFVYYSGPFNYMYAEPPIIAVLVGMGDCKAYAYYKYWALRQMGYTNVKLVTVLMPDGRGSLAGHVVVVLDDLWVLDINYPYVYPFEILRETVALDEAFFPDGSIWNVE